MGKQWWHRAIVYQIYPRSFMDSNADGIGDLNGITQKLDYLKNLGINTIWLCPIFASPMVDNGYDISDYCAVNPDFGSMADLEELLRQARARGIHILLDLVLNHSSNQHAWFKSAMQSPNSPYRDYYIFRKANKGQPPNNWRSLFGGSAWEKCPGSDEYYLHVFAVEQPDLNWENPKLREELYQMIAGWMDKGVDGFRIDAITYIKKDPSFSSLPPDGPDGLANLDPCCLAYPGIEMFLGELRDRVFAPRSAYTVAEAPGVSPARLEQFIGENGFFSTIFDFSYTDIDLAGSKWHTPRNFTRRELRDVIFASQQAVSAIGHGAVYLENHDQNRSINKYLAAHENTFAGQSLLGVLYFFLQGVPYIYQGQELGMTNYPWSSMEQFDDIATRSQYDAAIQQGYSEKEALAIVAHRSRDNSRIPMLWSSAPGAGFSEGSPWLPIHPEFGTVNAEAQTSNPSSIYHFYKAMVALRSGQYAELFFDGEFIPRFTQTDSVFAYERKLGREQVWIVCNFGEGAQTLDLPKSTILLGNIRSAGGALQGPCVVQPLEALVLKMGGE